MDDNTFFKEAVLRVSSSLDFTIAFRRVLELLETFMPIQMGSTSLYMPEEQVIRRVVDIALGDCKSSAPELPLTPDLIQYLEEKNAENQQVYIINDPHEDPISRAWLKLEPYWDSPAHMVVNLDIEGERICVLLIIGYRDTVYTEEHAQRVAMIADPMALALNNAMQFMELTRLKEILSEENKELNREIRKLSGDEIIGAQTGLSGVMEMVGQVARLDSPVLLLGETGVGKEVIANAIHSMSSRRDGAFIKVNCGAIPDSLIDSELFGYEKGAFTGASATKRGRFERANGGTLFLDEIGELPLAAQVRLLRVIQHKEIERVGGTETIPVNVRIISATHRNLETQIKENLFREDLWFRLNIFPITIPPLRQRTEDIPELTRYFMERKSIELKVHPVPPVTPSELERLKSWTWPGNIRELENMVERALIRNLGHGRGVQFDPSQSEPERRAGDTNETLLPMDQMVVSHIRKALSESGGKIHGKGGAAELLGMNPNTLRSRMRKLGMLKR